MSSRTQTRRRLLNRHRLHCCHCCLPLPHHSQLHNLTNHQKHPYQTENPNPNRLFRCLLIFSIGIFIIIAVVTFISWQVLCTKLDQIQEFKTEMKFTSKYSAKEITSKIEDAAKPLGFDIQKKNYRMRLQNSTEGRKGNLNVATKIRQVAPSFYMVELKKSKEDALEFPNFYQKLSVGLKDVVWKTEDDMQAHFLG